MTQATKQNDNIWPLILSVLVHVCVILALMSHTPYTQPAPPVIQTSFISGDEFGQISARLAQSAGISAQNKTVAEQANTAAKIAQKKAQYEQQLNEFHKQMLQQAQLNFDEFLTEQEALALQQQQALEAQKFKDASALEQSLEPLQDLKAEQAAKDAAALQNHSIEWADDASTDGNKTSNNNSGTSSHQNTNGHNNKGASGSIGAKSGVQTALIAHIKPHWMVSEAHKGKQLSAKISVDAKGNVLSVQILGGDTVLSASLESAIKRASPLTPIVNTNYRTLTITFVVQ